MPKHYGQERWRLFYTKWLPMQETTEQLTGLLHRVEQNRLEEEVGLLKADIEKSGLRNPVIATQEADERFNVHPGKCRMGALAALGQAYVPAIIVQHDKWGRFPVRDWWIPVEFADLGEYLDSDFEIVASWRNIHVKRVV